MSLFSYFFNNINASSHNILELKYDDLYHYLRRKDSYIVYILSLNDIDDYIKEIFTKKVKLIIEKFPKCKLEKTTLTNKLIYSNKSIDTILNELTLNNFVPKNNLELIDLTYQSKYLISFVLDLNKKQIRICFNHAIFDGIGFLEMALCFSNKTYISNFNFPKNTLVNTLYSLGKLLIERPILSSFNELKQDCESKTYSFKIHKKQIDNIKNKYNVSFMSAFQFIIFEKLKGFSSNFLVGTVLGVLDKSQNNSVGLVPYHIDLTKECVPIEIQNNLSKNSYMLMITSNKYIKTILRNLSSTHSRVDIVFSSIPISRENVYIGDTLITGYDNFYPNNLFPIYVFSVKVGEDIHINITVKNQKLISYLDQYNWNVL